MEPDFSPNTIAKAREIAASICSNPSCLRLCAGPENILGIDSRYIGEVAHISDARKRTIRWEPHRDNAYRAHLDNALFLCPTCHTTIDKNEGRDYPITLLKGWKKAHAELIHEALTGEYRLAHALKSQTAKAAQIQVLIDLCASMRVLRDDPHAEVPRWVLSSLVDLKSLARSLKRHLAKDVKTRKNLDLIIRAANAVLSAVQPYASVGTIGLDGAVGATLLLARAQIGGALSKLCSDFGIPVPAELAEVVQPTAQVSF